MWENKPISREGIFFSNELADSFPVHRIVFQDDSWRESHVAWENDHFVWKELPITHPSLQETIKTLSLPRIPGYVTEVNLAARNWLAELAHHFDRCFVITIDYGYLADQYYDPQRSEGTLLCYHRHQRSADPLRLVGEQDITAHVDFTSLMMAGQKVGLQTLGYTDQHHFMIGLAHQELATFEARGLHLEPKHQAITRAFRTLMHPEILGSSFKFLIQAKGLKNRPSLKGLQFARPSG